MLRRKKGTGNIRNEEIKARESREIRLSLAIYLEK